MGFQDDLQSWKEKLVTSGKRNGPAFEAGGHTLVWYDQVFERGVDPVGTVNCSQALRVGATHNGLDVALVASNANAGDLLIPAGSTITVSFMQGDKENDTFEDVGPTICMKAPAAGMKIKPDELVMRFPMGNMQKPWAMVNIEFSGAITGGTVDCVLAYMPR